MRTTGVCFVVLLLAIGCREDCRQKTARLYKEARNVLSAYREVNNFSMQLSYVPAQVLMRSQREDTAARDTSFYYFRLNVVAMDAAIHASVNTTALYYGLDSVFATSDTVPSAFPVLVEPVVTGNPKNFEYLLVFNKSDFSQDQVKVVFYDRLFTNTSQVFVFDRKKIDEIENLQCHPNET